MPYLSTWRPGFNPRLVSAESGVYKAALGQSFPRLRQFLPVCVTPSALHTCSFICHKCYIIAAVKKSLNNTTEENKKKQINFHIPIENSPRDNSNKIRTEEHFKQSFLMLLFHAEEAID